MNIDRAKFASLAATWRLSPREFEVLLAIIDGCATDHALAVRLGVALPTARLHVRNLLLKTGFRSKLELLAFLIRHLSNPTEVPEKNPHFH